MPNEDENFTSNWVERIKGAREYRRRYGQSDKWDGWRDIRRGDMKGLDQGVIGVNMTHAMLDAFLAEVLWGRIHVTCTPQPPLAPFAWERAKLLEAVNNRLVSSMSLKRHIEMASLCACTYGTGIISIGFGSEFGTSAPVISGDEEELAEKSRVDSEAHVDKKLNRIEYKTDIIPGQPWTQWRSPKDFLVPFGTVSLDEVEWIAYQISRPLKDLKADGRYSNTEGAPADSATTMERESFARDRRISDLTYRPETVTFWEIHDRKTGRVYAISERYPRVMLNEEDGLQTSEGLPAVDLIFNPDDEGYWGISDIKLIEQQQMELNDIRTQAQKARRLSVLKFLYRANSMTEGELAKLLSENCGAGAEINQLGASQSLADVVQILQPHAPQELMMDGRTVMDDMQTTVGYNENTMGSFRAGRKTATEAKAVVAGHQNRLQRRRDMILDAIKRTLAKVDEICFEQWDEEQVVNVTTQDNKMLWVSFTGKDLKGKYSTEISIELLDPVTMAEQRQEALQALQVVATTQDPQLIAMAVKALLGTFQNIDMQMPGPSTSAAMPFQNFAESGGTGQMYGGSAPQPAAGGAVGGAVGGAGGGGMPIGGVGNQMGGA
jgi:hypothetical protein